MFRKSTSFFSHSELKRASTVLIRRIWTNHIFLQTLLQKAFKEKGCPSYRCSNKVTMSYLIVRATRRQKNNKKRANKLEFHTRVFLIKNCFSNGTAVRHLPDFFCFHPVAPCWQTSVRLASSGTAVPVTPQLEAGRALWKLQRLILLPTPLEDQQTHTIPLNSQQSCRWENNRKRKAIFSSITFLFAESRPPNWE